MRYHFYLVEYVYLVDQFFKAIQTKLWQYCESSQRLNVLMEASTIGEKSLRLIIDPCKYINRPLHITTSTIGEKKNSAKSQHNDEREKSEE